MKLSLQRKRPALSEIVSSILIIAIALVAIGILYAFFTSTTTRVQNTTTFRVTGQLIGGSSPILTLTVTNTGSIAINGLTVTTNGFTLSGGTTIIPTTSWNPAVTSTSLLAPGQSASATVTLTATGAGSVTPGNTYSVTIQATFVNGATVTQVLQLTAQ